MLLTRFEIWIEIGFEEKERGEDICGFGVVQVWFGEESVRESSGEGTEEGEVSWEESVDFRRGMTYLSL